MADEHKQDEPAFRVASEVYDIGKDRGTPTPGLSQSPGLRSLDGSPVPGANRSHVVGPQQSAVDPVLAGLDTGYDPLTRAENRVITRMADGAMVVPPPDRESEALPGPSSTSAPAAETAQAEAAKVTPTTILTPATPAPSTPAPSTPAPATSGDA